MTTYTVVHRADSGAVVVLGPFGFHVLAPTGEEIGVWHARFQAIEAADRFETGEDA